MRRRFLYWLTARLRARLICIDDRPYLERYYLGRVFGVTCYLHRFVAPDQDRSVHDHPWQWAGSLVLAGHYLEEVVRWFTPDAGWCSRYVRRCWWRPNLMNARTLHRIHSAAPDTWTLFMHGDRCKRWGFLEHMQHGALTGALYRQHLDDQATIGWEQSAPLGRDVGRMPYPLPPPPNLSAECGHLAQDD